MALLKNVDGDWVFKRGKHVDTKLEDVATDDPSYLQWVFENATEGMQDDAFKALEEVMEENEIEFP